MVVGTGYEVLQSGVAWNSVDPVTPGAFGALSNSSVHPRLPLPSALETMRQLLALAGCRGKTQAQSVIAPLRFA